MLAQPRQDVFWILVRDEPEIKFGRRFGRQHRLRAGALVAGGDAGDVAGRRKQELLDDMLRRRVAHQALEADELLSLLYLGVDPRHHLPVGAGGLHDPLIEPIDADVHLLVAQAGERLDQVRRRRRIDGREARVLVVPEQLHAQLHVEETAAPELQGGPPAVVEGRARLPQAAVRTQLVGVLEGDLLEGLGADLLLALDEESQRDRDLAQALQCLERVDAGHHVRLVIGNAAGDDPAILLGRLERVRVPELDWVDRLHVVVLVQEQLSPSGSGHFRVKGRHAALVQRLHPVREPAQALADPVSCRPHRIQPVVRDARKSTELLELLDEAARVLLDVRVDGAG